MNRLLDANNIYDAGAKAVKSCSFKKSAQYYEMNHLLNTAHLQEELRSGCYKPDSAKKSIHRARGKTRLISSNTMRDKTLNHLFCDEILTPSINRYIIYDNTSSQKGKGVSLERQRLVYRLRQFYSSHGDNDGYILLTDFSGYFANIRHKECFETVTKFINQNPDLSSDEKALSATVLRSILDSFALDVSRFSDTEIERMYREKVDPTMNLSADQSVLTGEKYLYKGVDIGNQSSQNIGVAHPYYIDNFVKIRKGVKGYGRYTDDLCAMSRSRSFLVELMQGLRAIAPRFGLIINEKKTRICKLSSFFRHLKIGYSLTDTGRIMQKIHPKALTYERRKLKSYKKMLDEGRIPYAEVENSFKSWLGSNYKNLSRRQLDGIVRLYYDLFGRSVTWRKKHGRLRYLMVRALRGYASTATILSLRRSSPKPTLRRSLSA